LASVIQPRRGRYALTSGFPSARRTVTGPGRFISA